MNWEVDYGSLGLYTFFIFAYLYRFSFGVYRIYLKLGEKGHAGSMVRDGSKMRGHMHAFHELKQARRPPFLLFHTDISEIAFMTGLLTVNAFIDQVLKEMTVKRVC